MLTPASEANLLAATTIPFFAYSGSAWEY